MSIIMGTCSWKYDSWQGIVYPDQGKFNHLEEYAKHFNSVEIDQWFWSLFGVDKIKLPDTKTVDEYLKAVPNHFLFTIKIPNSITLTHFYTRGQPKGSPLAANPHFFSIDLFNEFLKRIQPLNDHIGVLMFQFEYLNKKKMASQGEFLQKFNEFIKQCPREYNYAVEIRNPNYLNDRYFEFLNLNDLYHIFVQGYYMPHIMEIYRKHSDFIRKLSVIRLMGPDRQAIEKKSGNKWGAIVDPKDSELTDIIAIIKELEERKIDVYLNINNHYEGSAPLTIKKIQEMLKV
ncbi:DUF72 domain-containing protein [Acidobacteriota bacterium]